MHNGMQSRDHADELMQPRYHSLNQGFPHTQIRYNCVMHLVDLDDNKAQNTRHVMRRETKRSVTVDVREQTVENESLIHTQQLYNTEQAKLHTTKQQQAKLHTKLHTTAR